MGINIACARKTCFESEREALAARDKFAMEGNKPYRCYVHDAWHLGHSKKRGSRRGFGKRS